MYEDLNYLDDDVCVCYTCYKNGNITTMKINPKDNQFLLPPDCGHMKKGFRKIAYDNKTKTRKATIGLKININELTKYQCQKCGEYIDKDQEIINHNVIKNSVEEDIVINFHMHLDCFNSIININFDKNEHQKHIYYHICPKCNFEELTLGNIWMCKECGYKNATYHQICNNCGYEEDSKELNWNCPKCHNNKPYFMYCENCGYEENTNITTWTCPECGKYTTYKEHIYEHICPNCGNSENNNTPPNTWKCSKCGWKPDNFLGDYVSIYDHICENPDCGYRESNKTPISTWRCPECGWKRDTDYFHVCIHCGNTGYNKCSIWTCPECHRINRDNFKHICPECGNSEETNSSIWTCSKCGWKNRNFNHKCPKCGKEESNYAASWKCPDCGWENENYKAIINVTKRNIKYCEKCNCETIHNGNDECLVCKGTYIWCEVHNRFETINNYNNEILPKKYILTFCPSCNSETPHKYNQQTRELECQVCNGKLIYNFYIDKYIKIDDFELIEENKNQERYYMYILEKKGIDSTIVNIRRYKSLAKRNSLSFESFVNSLVWCPHCERWETPSFNSRPNHWMFWAAETKQWMDNNPNKIELSKKTIKGLDILLNSTTITGIYGWFINDKISYIGESTDILTRSWNHIMYIFEEPDYWYNVIDYFDKNKIEVKILKSIDKNCNEYKNMSNKEFKKNVLKPLELDFIAKLHPDSQKCDGTDHMGQ